MMAFLGRSGSSSILYDLAHHPKVIVHMEVFGGATLPGERPQTDRNRADFLNQMWAGYRHPELMPRKFRGCARGFKLQFKREASQFGRLGLLSRTIAANNAVVIALRRRDVLRQAISSFRAEQLAEISQAERGALDYHIKPESGPRARAFAHKTVTVDIPRLEQLLDEIAANRANMEKFLRKSPPALELTYEAYLADRLSVLNRILAVLELEPFAQAPQQDLAKVTNDDLSKAVTNYAEVRAFAEERGLSLE